MLLLIALACHLPSADPVHSLMAQAGEAPPAADPWAEVPTADRFDLPVSPPDGAGWRIARGWREKGHLGLDWNARGACNDDLGMTVHAVADGTVLLAEDVLGGWGNVVQLVHRLPDGSLVQSQYGHLDRIDVVAGHPIRRGEPVGTVGNNHGMYCAHLHFEVREGPDNEIGGGYGEPGKIWVDPLAFLAEH